MSQANRLNLKKNMTARLCWISWYQLNKLDCITDGWCAHNYNPIFTWCRRRGDCHAISFTTSPRADAVRRAASANGRAVRWPAAAERMPARRCCLSHTVRRAGPATPIDDWSCVVRTWRHVTVISVSIGWRSNLWRHVIDTNLYVLTVGPSTANVSRRLYRLKVGVSTLQ